MTAGKAQHLPTSSLRRRRAGSVALAVAVFATTLVVATATASAALTSHQRQIAVGADAVSAPTFSVTVPAGVSTVAGRHLVVAYLFSGAGTNKVVSITDTRGNAYTINAVRQNTAGTTGLIAVVASAKITTALVAGDTVTVTQNVESTYHAMEVYEFDNFDPTSWVDKTATGNASGTAVSTASTQTTAQSSETLFAAVGFGDTTATLTSAPDWNDSAKIEATGSKHKSLAAAVRDVAATGAFSYAGTLSATEQWVAALVTFRTVSTPPSGAPTASFTASPTSGTAPLTVQFTDTSSGSPTAWVWDFGDGTGSTAQNPAHTYAAGTWTVKLTVSNNAGSDTVTRAGLISAGSSGDIGYMDGSTSGAGAAATGEKPESKLWWNDGFWWASMFDAVSQSYHIFRLDRSTERWVDTSTLLDNRPRTHADTLWDGSHLYVASHVTASSSSAATSGNPARLYRFSYSPSTDTYSLDAGFPVQINDFSSETLTIDKDSTGVLWATWAQASTIYVNSTTAGDAVWGTPLPLPVTGASGLEADDISAVVAFGGNQIGVMWSNQVVSAMYFAIHADGAQRDTWATSRTAVQGPGSADDHINLKQLQGDTSGRVFAAVKTSFDDVGGSSSAPQILILARDPATGDWSSAPFGRISDCHTRPILMLDSQHAVLHVFATAPDSGCPFSGSAGTIFEKTSPMDNISFPLGRGTPVIRDAASPNLNNVTSSKQNVTAATGLVVLTSNDVTKRYWHADISLGTP